jgi:iron complex outermembrane receptor protein
VTTKAAYRPGGVYGLSCPATGGCTESQAFPLPPELEFLLASRPDPNEDIRINRPLDFVGPRTTSTDTTSYQLLFGLEGEVFRDSLWEVYVSHGTTQTVVNYGGVVGRERWRELVQSPNFGKGFTAQGNEEGAGFAGGFASCTTGLPIVREFDVSDDCIDALTASLQNNTDLEQNILEATLTGSWMDLPAGTVGYAVGATYRDEIYSYKTDSYTTNESWTATALGMFPTSNTSGEFDVSELYGELLIPLVADKPGARHLNLEVGGRVSDYSTVGSVETYKALLDWAVNPWVRVRGGINRAMRAPNIGELFLSRTQQFGGTGTILGDQCSENNQDGPYSANPDANVYGAEGAARTKAICEAIMGPQGAAAYYGRPVEDQPTTGGTGIPNWIGNPNLGPEEADTFTLGVVIDSPFEGDILGGFTFTIDYYEIEITDMIAVEDGDAVFQRCLDPAFNPDGDPNAPACRAMLRDPFNGNPVSMDLSYTNLGRAVTSGVDVQVNWAMELATRGRLSVNVLGNYNLENVTQADPDVAEIDWVGTRGCALGLQCMGYDYRLFSTATYSRGPFSVSLRWQHWPSIESGNAATNPDTPFPGVPSSYDLFDLTGSYRLGDKYRLRMGIQNLFDKEPPLGGGDPTNDAFPRDPTHAGGAVYDPFGRRAFVGLTMDF